MFVTREESDGMCKGIVRDKYTQFPKHVLERLTHVEVCLKAGSYMIQSLMFLRVITMHCKHDTLPSLSSDTMYVRLESDYELHCILTSVVLILV